VRLLIIWFGANDAAVPASVQHVPLPQYIANMKQLIQMIKNPESPYYAPHTQIIIITPPPVNEIQRTVFLAGQKPPLELDRGFELTKSYAAAAKKTGEEAGLGVADVWTKIWDRAGHKESALDKYLSDGLHLTKDGYEVGNLS